MKFLLANPPTGRYMRSDRCQAPVDTRVAEPARPPMDLAYIAAVLRREGHECVIRDYPMEDLGWGAAREDLMSLRPGALVISVTTPTIDQDLRLCSMAKELDGNTLTIAKGAHFFVYDTLTLQRCAQLDIAVRGEAEQTIKEIAGCADAACLSGVNGITFRKDGRTLRTPDRDFIRDLDSLPLPARELIDNSLYRAPDTGEPIAFITTSRGCAGACVFCYAALVSGKTLRQRSVASVIDEIRECVVRYNIKDFFFAADTFTWDKKWVIDLCKGILDKGFSIRWGANSRVDTLDEEVALWMKKAGCHVIGFGAESASQRMLDAMGKGIKVAQIEKALDICRSKNIDTFLVFLVGLPWETKDSIDETAAFVKRCGASFIEVNVAYPLPGTGFYEFGREEGLFNDEDLCGHDYSSGMARSFELTRDEIKLARKKILASFYSRPEYFARTIRRIRSAKMLINYMKAAARLALNLART